MSKIALAALIALAASAPAFAQQKASSPKPKHTLAATMQTPGTPGKFASAPGTQGPKGAPPVGLYRYRVRVIDQAGNAAAPKPIDDFAADIQKPGPVVSGSTFGPVKPPSPPPRTGPATLAQ